MQTDIRYKIKWNIRGNSSSTWLNGMIIYRLIPGEMKSEKYVYKIVKKYGWLTEFSINLHLRTSETRALVFYLKNLYFYIKKKKRIQFTSNIIAKKKKTKKFFILEL